MPRIFQRYFKNVTLFLFQQYLAFGLICWYDNRFYLFSCSEKLIAVAAFDRFVLNLLSTIWTFFHYLAFPKEKPSRERPDFPTPSVFTNAHNIVQDYSFFEKSLG